MQFKYLTTVLLLSFATLSFAYPTDFSLKSQVASFSKNKWTLKKELGGKRSAALLAGRGAVDVPMNFGAKWFQLSKTGDEVTAKDLEVVAWP